MADFGGGYYGSGPTSTWGRWLFAAGAAVAGVVTLFVYDGGGKAIFISVMFVAAVFFALMAIFGPRITAWSERRRADLQGTWGNTPEDD